jgi:DNA-binding transcriptional LysR family regulator
MLETARNVLTDAHALMVPSRFNPHLDHAHFRIGASDYAALTIVPVLIARLRAAAPSVTLEVLPVGPSIFEDLESGRLDLSFWGTAPPAKPFLYSQLFEECFVGLADAQHHIFARSFKDAITLDQFLAYPHLTVSLGDPGISAVDQALTALGRTRRVGATSFSFIGSIATLQGSDFLASAPSRLVRVGTFPSLHKFDLPLKVPPYAYGMIWHPRTNAAQSHIWLRKLTKSAVLSV